MPPKKKKTESRTAQDFAESEEVEFFVIDDESLANLLDYVNSLAAEVNNLRNDNESLHEQIRDLERHVRAARYN